MTEEGHDPPKRGVNFPEANFVPLIEFEDHRIYRTKRERIRINLKYPSTCVIISSSGLGTIMSLPSHLQSSRTTWSVSLVMEQTYIYASLPWFPCAEAFSILKSLSMDQSPRMNCIRRGPGTTTGSAASVLM